MMTKNLIFDIDGTLWDATKQITVAYNTVIKKENESYPLISEEQMASVMGMVIEDIAKVFFPYLEEEKQMDLIHKCCENENIYLKEHGGCLYPDVLEVLDELYQRGYHIYIISNCQDGYIEALCHVYPIGKYVLDSECSGRTSLNKGENICLLMERQHLDDAIYIGDTQKDKDACEQAGIAFIYASYGFGQVDAYDQKIDSFKDLLSILSDR